MNRSPHVPVCHQIGECEDYDVGLCGADELLTLESRAFNRNIIVAE